MPSAQGPVWLEWTHDVGKTLQGLSSPWGGRGGSQMAVGKFSGSPGR